MKQVTGSNVHQQVMHLIDPWVVVSNIFYFHRKNCGRFPFCGAYFSKGLVQPPSRSPCKVPKAMVWSMLVVPLCCHVRKLWLAQYVLWELPRKNDMMGRAKPLFVNNANLARYK